MTKTEHIELNRIKFHLTRTNTLHIYNNRYNEQSQTQKKKKKF